MTGLTLFPVPCMGFFDEFTCTIISYHEVQ